MACWRAGSSRIITSRTPPARICVAGWGGFRRPGFHMRGRWPWLRRGRSVVSWPGGCGKCNKKAGRCRFSLTPDDYRVTQKERHVKYICLGYYDPGKHAVMTEDERNAMF